VLLVLMAWYLFKVSVSAPAITSMTRKIPVNSVVKYAFNAMAFCQIIVYPVKVIVIALIIVRTTHACVVKICKKIFTSNA
jgi:hypothetical protein